MEIENHKEEVPFAYYQGLFEKLDPAETAARAGVKWDGKEFYVNLLGKTYAIAWPEYGIRICHSEEQSDEESVMSGGRDGFLAALRNDRERDGFLTCAGHDRGGTDSSALPRNDRDMLPLQGQTFLLRYLLEGKAVAWNGGWKTFREMPWGELYIKPYTGRVLTRAAFTFGTRLEKFRAACQSMGAVPLKHGDAGYQFDFIGGFAMQIMVWAGDEEFPPSAQVIYSDNFADGFAPEDRVVAGDILISAIQQNM